MNKYLLTLIVFLIPQISYGDLIFTPSDSDLSLNYLKMLFGYIEGVLLSEGSQLLGRISSVLNSALLAVGGTILIYVVVTEIIKTANTGQVLGGSQNNNMWLPIRIVTGIALLVPKASGYSTMQAFIMWIIIQGIGFANSITGKTLDYLEQGGTLIEKKLTQAEEILPLEGK